MEAPCQKIVWDVLPAIRAAIAAELVHRGVSQADAAKMLEIAPSAVSQYLSGKRGYRIEFGDDAKKTIGQLAQDLEQKRVDNLISRICDICRQVRNDGEQCRRYEGRCGP